MPPESDGPGDEDFSLVYLCRHELEEDGVYRGGALVVDRRGTPQEFRCTSPIRPNMVQRTLYGESLAPYMATELIGQPLLSHLREDYDLIVVDEPWFLNIRREQGEPVIYVRRQGAEFSSDGAGEGREELLDPGEGRFEPIVVAAFEDREDDIRSGISLLREAAQAFDPMEPFTRVTRALDRVHEEEVLSS